jgi:hypothetical protein
VVAVTHPEGLEVGGVAAGLVVELGIGHGYVLPTHHEGQAVTARGTDLDPSVQCQHVGFDPPAGPVVTGQIRF